MRRILTLALLLAAISAPVLAQQTRMTRPRGAEGPTPVEVAIVVVEVLEIDDANESFDIDFILQARWRDERLAWDPIEHPNAAVLRFEISEAWHPRLILMNEKSLDLRMPDHLQVASDGSVLFAQRFQGLMTTPLELREFPADRQRLPIRMVAGNYSPGEVALSVSEAFTAMLESTHTVRTPGRRVINSDSSCARSGSSVNSSMTSLANAYVRRLCAASA